VVLPGAADGGDDPGRAARAADAAQAAAPGPPLRVTLDADFPAVLAACAGQLRPQDRTWITPEVAAAFTALHGLGFAHSVEVWDGELLVGGLYGLAIGAVFFGESMFSRQPGASKRGFIALVQQLERWDFGWSTVRSPPRTCAALGGQRARARGLPRGARRRPYGPPGGSVPGRFDDALTPTA
jgi:leucyl/phenylalanyl-tRNA--protein transferase